MIVRGIIQTAYQAVEDGTIEKVEYDPQSTETDIYIYLEGYEHILLPKLQEHNPHLRLEDITHSQKMIFNLALRNIFQWGQAVPHFKGHSRISTQVGYRLNIVPKSSVLESSIHGNLEVVKLLISEGADVNAKNKDGKTPRDIARAMGNSEIGKYLFRLTPFGKALRAAFNISLGFLWCVGLLGVLGGLKILPGVNLGLFQNFDFQAGFAGVIRLFYDSLYQYCLPNYITCFVGSLTTAVFLREKLWGRIVTYVIASVPALFPILYLVLWILINFAVAP